jgi:hypothetical protein
VNFKHFYNLTILYINVNVNVNVNYFSYLYEYIISKIINLCNFKLFLIKRSYGRFFLEKGRERVEEKVEKEYITKNVLTNYFNCIIIFIE